MMMTSHDGVTGSDGRLINTLDTEERPEVVGGGSSCSVFEMGASVDGGWEEGGEETDDAEEEEEATPLKASSTSSVAGKPI